MLPVIFSTVPPFISVAFGTLSSGSAAYADRGVAWFRLYPAYRPSERGIASDNRACGAIWAHSELLPGVGDAGCRDCGVALFPSGVGSVNAFGNTFAVTETTLPARYPQEQCRCVSQRCSARDCSPTYLADLRETSPVLLPV